MSNARIDELEGEVRRLRALIQRQVEAYDNTPMSHLNAAGVAWIREARAALGEINADAAQVEDAMWAKGMGL